MKRLVGKDITGSYTFNKAARTVTLVSVPYTITLSNLLMINNATSNIMLYNFTDTTKTATISGNVITLAYDTSSMSNTDILDIWVSIESFEATYYTLMMNRALMLAYSASAINFNGMQMLISDSSPNTYPITSPSGLGPTIPQSVLVETPLISNGTLPNPWMDYTFDPPVDHTSDFIYTYPTQDKYVINNVSTTTVARGPIDPRWEIIYDSQMAYGKAIRSKLTW